ncbi:fimbria/pilus periplasmic chaperone [Providencia hangzhouensis]|uniref:fimbria/pilus periplasmic chaperone n=1 Tax=Providencia hangzhouensis TaxID=3031799 RepID=UPI0034DD5A99
MNIPFMVTPPLHKLEAGNSYTWRVMFIGDSDKLAKDRETVYIVKYNKNLFIRQKHARK